MWWAFECYTMTVTFTVKPDRTRVSVTVKLSKTCAVREKLYVAVSVCRFNRVCVYLNIIYIKLISDYLTCGAIYNSL